MAGVVSSHSSDVAAILIFRMSVLLILGTSVNC
jgi:hypothetical protein